MKQDMKVQQKRFNRVVKILGVGNFYNVSLTQYHIRLQGTYSPELVKILSKHFKFNLESSGYIEAERGFIQIVLT